MTLHNNETNDSYLQYHRLAASNLRKIRNSLGAGDQGLKLRDLVEILTPDDAVPNIKKKKKEASEEAGENKRSVIVRTAAIHRQNSSDTYIQIQNQCVCTNDTAVGQSLVDMNAGVVCGFHNGLIQPVPPCEEGLTQIGEWQVGSKRLGQQTQSKPTSPHQAMS